MVDKIIDEINDKTTKHVITDTVMSKVDNALRLTTFLAQINLSPLPVQCYIKWWVELSPTGLCRVLMGFGEKALQTK